MRSLTLSTSMHSPSYRLCAFLCLFVITSLLSAQELAGLDVQADNLQFEQEANVVTATGNVVLRKGAQSLTADKITYNTVTEQATATGNVVFTDEERVWTGETLEYNFLTGQGSFPNLEFVSGPFTVNAGGLERLGPVQTQLNDVVVTTCPDTEDPEFAISAKRVDVYEDQVYLMRNALFRFHGVPFFWVPRLTFDVNREPTHLDVIPGYGSRDGAYLLNTYNRYPADGYQTKTHFDYRTERGPALGQDWIWFEPVEDKRRTEIKVYGALDDAPYKNDTNEAQLRSQGIEIEEERYRLKLDHRQQLTGQDAIYLKAEYLSDARVVDDFFDDEFRESPVPETRATYSAVGDSWNAGINLVQQLNADEFESVNRLPEATFNVPLRSVSDLGLQYESESSAGFLERTFTKFQRDAGSREYDSLRLHTDHTLYYPQKYNGWLNIIPRVGFAATYYDTTRVTDDVVTPESTVDENGVITTNFVTEEVTSDGDSDIRFLPEIGVETSFKAFGIVHEDPTSLGEGLRHVVEPFIDYTFIPDPSLGPDEIYQFDTIDELGETHEIGLGIRNKWQTRIPREGSAPKIHDLVNLDLRTIYDLRSEADPNLNDLLLDVIWYPTEWMFWRIRANYDSDGSTIGEMTAELTFRNQENGNSLRIDQRYREDASHTLQFRYELNPKGDLGLKGYTRLELEDDGVEEQGLTFIIRTDCVGYGIGGSWQRGETYADGTEDEDDWTVYAQFWLTAFPKAIIGSGMD